MLRTFSPLYCKEGCCNWVRLFTRSFHPPEDLPSRRFSGIAKTLISEWSCIRDCKTGQNHTSRSPKDYFVRLSYISPETVRKFWRVSTLKPRDVFEILVGFEFDRGNCEIEVGKVESLWAIFNFASAQTEGFEHFPQSCKIMASMLVRVGFFTEVELLLSRKESQGILLDCQEIFSKLIEGYVGRFELDMALSVFGRTRKLSLVPSLSSYLALLKYLAELNEPDFVHQVYVDMIMMGMGMTGTEDEIAIHQSVIRLLCNEGKVQEARNLVKKVMECGIKPSNVVLNAISCGYCDKKDYNDLLNFFAEVGIVPDIGRGNKILFSFCKDFGVEQGSEFLLKLEELGFYSDEITLGILIGFCCREGKLKNALFCISGILSRGLKPHVYSYDALLSEMFDGGMWMLCEDLIDEMSDVGVCPELSTFKVLLAGFCKARKFDKVRSIVREMADRNLVTLSSLEDPLTKGFVILGLDPLSMRIKRDNDKGLSKTEFFDVLGNGLYLDTDMDVYEGKISQVLNEARIPDFNSFILDKCRSADIRDILAMVDEMEKWGQEMSLIALSSLLYRLTGAPYCIEPINHHLEVMSKSCYQLDQKALNILVQTYSRRRFTFRARTLFEGMVRRGCEVENTTYSVLLFDTCNKGDLKSFNYYYGWAKEAKWSPKVKECKPLLSHLCQNKWINEALEIFETMLCATPADILDTLQSFLGDLCCQGFTDTAYLLLHEYSNQAMVLDHMAYSRVVNGFCQEKRLGEALKVFEIMLAKDFSPPIDVYTQLVSHFCKTRNFEKAIELKNICLRNQPSMVTRMDCALITGFCKSAMVEEANSLLKELLLNGLFTDSGVYNSVILGYCRVNNWSKVRELLVCMIRKNLSISISSYSNMVQLICTEGRLPLAMKLKELMVQVTDFSELILCNIMIFHISTSQNSLMLDAVIDALCNKRVRFDDVTYNFLIRGYLLCKDISRSLHYLKAMMKLDLTPSGRSLRQVITCLCRSGKLALALDLNREMELRGWIHGGVVQTIILDELINNGMVDKAVEFVDRMTLNDIIPKNMEYDYLIKRFYQHGRLGKAIDLLNIILQKGRLPNSTSYDCIIQGFCSSHKLELDKALDFYNEMLCRGLKPSMATWDILVFSLSKHGRVGVAEEVLRTIIELGETPSREAFESVLNKLRYEGNKSNVSEVLKLMQEKGYVPDFDTHWSVISNLNRSCKKDESFGSSSFLSNLLSGFGFSGKK